MVAPIVGITKEKYLNDFMGALEISLDAEDIEALEKHYTPHPIVGHK